MTAFSFAPSSKAPYQFQATLDGQVYQCLVKWNLGGQRWYLECYDLSGNLIFAKAMVASASYLPVNLAWPYFTTSSICYYASSSQIVVTP